MFQIVLMGSDREAAALRLNARLEQQGLCLTKAEVPSASAMHKSFGSDLLLFTIDTAIAFGGVGGAISFVDWAMAKRGQQRSALELSADLQHAQQLLQLLNSEQSADLSIQIINQKTGLALTVDRRTAAVVLDQLRSTD